MKREFYIIICFLCFLVAAYAFQPQITHLASAAIQTVKQYIEEKRTPYVYEKGIQRQPEEKEAASESDAAARVAQLMAEGLSRKDAVKQTAKELDLPKNVVYDIALKEQE